MKLTKENISTLLWLIRSEMKVQHMICAEQGHLLVELEYLESLFSQRDDIEI